MVTRIFRISEFLANSGSVPAVELFTFLLISYDDKTPRLNDICFRPFHVLKSASIILKDKKTERKRIINAGSCSVGKTTLLNATLEPVNYLAFTWQERGCCVEMVKKALIEVTLVGESYTTANREIEDEIVLELSRNLYAVPWAERIERIRVRGK